MRGVRDTGSTFLLPTYLFVGTLLTVIVIGTIRTIAAHGHPLPIVAPPRLPVSGAMLSLWVLAKVFASGCTAMTGVEAVSNGIMAFREPKQKNARRTLTIIIFLLMTFLAGIALLCRAYSIGATEPGVAGYQSILSQLTAAVIGRGWFYYLTIASILSVVVLSANTSYADFPRLTRAIAINDYLLLLHENATEAARWKTARDELKRNIRKHLWDVKRQKFIPHVYLAGSPFPKDFDENAIYYHGGTAVAIEAGLLTRNEVARSLDQMVANVRAAGAGSIGLMLYPPYPEGFFKNPQMHSPYSYQNGGDWCWFGGRMIQALIKEDYIAEAYRELRPMVGRVKRAGGFHEWWSRDDQPRGSGEFRGSAGVLGRAIELLQVWAEHNRRPSPDGHSGEGRP